MYNSKKTIKSQMSDMYGEGGNLNIGKNKTTKELRNNISNSNLNKNLNLNEQNQKNEQNQTDSYKDSYSDAALERKESLKVPGSGMGFFESFNILYMVIIIVIVIIISIIIVYIDNIILFFNNLFNNSTDAKVDNTAAKVDNTAAKVDNTAAKVENTTAKVNETSAKVDSTSAKIDSTFAKVEDLDKKVDNLITKSTCSNPAPAVSTLNNKINNKSKDSNVATDSFCYIGYDNGQRECIDVYAGDVCMSGEIFPSLDICINPTLRQ
jgi:uncharacterized protein YoxC